MTFRFIFNRTRVLGTTAALLALVGAITPATAQTGSNVIDPAATAGMPGSIMVAEGSLPTSEPVNIPAPSPDPAPSTSAAPAAATSAPEPAPHSEPVVSEGTVPDVTMTTPIVDEVVVATPAPLSPSQNVTINLINRLVEKGILTKQDAAELVKQAEADTMVAQQQAAEQQAAAIQGAVAVALQEQAAVMQAQAAPSEPLVMDDTVRVTYVPEVVKKQIREQLKLDVMSQAKAEGWANTGNLPPWVKSIRPFADIRVRYEADFFPSGNDNTGAFPNFNAINTGAPFDVAGNQFSPQLNVDQDRNRMRLRARFGAEADLGENFTAGLRIATGENNSPVSANQSFGYSGGTQGGQFSKYAIWLDRAFIRYEIGEEAKRNLGLVFGRFDNPFFTVSSIMWDDDIGFDGVALQSNFEVVRGVTPFLNAGAFPIYNTDFNFSSNQPAKFPSDDKWMFGAQLGTNWQINKDFNLTVGGSYYYFYNVAGKLSTPYTPLTQNDAGDTDGLRPSFAQKGNTYMALRDIVPNASNDFGTTNQWQYFGLATPYQNVAFAGRLNYDHFAPFRVSLSGEFVKNVAFNKSEIDGKAVNNRGALDDSLSDTIGAFAGGDTAWTVQLQAGTAGLEKRWDWNIAFGYRYVESDAVIDGFTESDFGGGGTNLKGYVIGGNLALSSNVWVGVRWMSAESIAGPQYKEDILQFDLNAKF